jgi:23S rRNA pseudoU1915 N3-methylase RlmH
MLEDLCFNKRKNKSAKFSENLNALSILKKKRLFLRIGGPAGYRSLLANDAKTVRTCSTLSK